MKLPVRVTGAVLSLVALAVLAVLYLGKPYVFNGSVIEPSRPAADFELMDQNRDPFRLGDQSGRVVLLFFGYTYCPDVCPTTLSDYQFLERQLGDLASRVRFVFVTVDPDRDTPEKLGSHLALFSPNFTGLSGSLEELEPVYRAYGVFREIEPIPQGEGYLVNHSTRIYLIDSVGNLRLTFPFGMDRQEMLRDVEHLVKE